MAISSSITKIRRYVRDTESRTFSDSHILALFGRIQQEFCKDSLLLCDVVLLKAPPFIEYCCTYEWEKSFVDADVFIPYFSDGENVATQPWELEVDFSGDISGGDTITSSADLLCVEPQHRWPLFGPSDLYSVCALYWNYKHVEEKSIQWVEERRLDGFTKRGNVVDYFAPTQSGRDKAFYTHGIPYDVQESGTNKDSQIGEELLADVFYLFYNKVPERPTVTTESAAVPAPFVKYIEFGVAAALHMESKEKRDILRGAHYNARYKLGVKLAQGLINKRIAQVRRGMNGLRSYKGKRPSRPRLPDHYPKWSY